MPIATCVLTETNLLRLLMNPFINEEPIDSATGLALLERLHEHPRHRFLKENPSPCDPSAKAILVRVSGYRQVADAYLLSLAMANDGKLATLDRRLAARFGEEIVEVVGG